jgi:hypothetical protein
MTMELKEAALDRVGRLMRINGIKSVRTRKHKVTTDSHHRLGVAANWLDGDVAVFGGASAPAQQINQRITRNNRVVRGQGCPVRHVPSISLALIPDRRTLPPSRHFIGLSPSQTATATQVKIIGRGSA